MATEIAIPRADALLARMAGRKVVVIGDVMIDEWIWGRVSRISPEAPVPVVAVHDHSFTPVSYTHLDVYKRQALLVSRL